MELVLLSKAQNEAFDTEYHSADELTAKIQTLASRFGQSPVNILDVGGGNGRFLDSLLAALPNAQGTLVDISADLLAQNSCHPRKTVIAGSISDILESTSGIMYNVIAINWVLHHLVGRSYKQSRRNIVECLIACSALLAPGGVIVVADNMFDGFFGLNSPSHLIYDITRIRWGPFVRLASRFFNTSGVGVCFQSRHAWKRLFAKAALVTVEEHPGKIWCFSWRSRTAFSLLTIQSVSHRHFYLMRNEEP